MSQSLPSDWKVVKLGDYCHKPQYGYTTSATSNFTGIQFLRITDIQDGRVQWENVPYCKCDEAKVESYLLALDDIVIARIGATTGKTFIIRECPKAIFASYLIRVRTKTNLLPSFLNFYCQTESYWQHIEQTKGGRLKGGVNIPILEDLRIPLPPIAEQKAIAHTLQTIQQAKEARQRELTLERERKAALMQDLFIYGTCGERQKLTEIGAIPENWEVVELGNVCKVSSGGTPSREKPEYWNGDIPWVKTGEINYNIITETEEKISRLGLANSAAKIIPSGTLLMAMYGQGVTRGRVAILGINATINQACAAISTPDHLSTEFLFYWLAHNYERIRLLGHGANQKNLNALIVKSIPVVLPSYEEQCVIAETLQACDRKITALENELAVLNELFHVMLENLMAGRLPIKEQEAAPL